MRKLAIAIAPPQARGNVVAAADSFFINAFQVIWEELEPIDQIAMVLEIARRQPIPCDEIVAVYDSRPHPGALVVVGGVVCRLVG